MIIDAGWTVDKSLAVREVAYAALFIHSNTTSVFYFKKRRNTNSFQYFVAK
jgi:hypothetical protein